MTQLPTTTTTTATPATTTTTTVPATPQLEHGYEFTTWWRTQTQEPLLQPRCVASSTEAARPGYAAASASEYLDHPQVLAMKITFLVEKLRQSKATVAFTGAGLSSANIPDYASRAAGSQVRGTERSGNRKTMPPCVGHRVLAALAKRSLVHHFLEQNHDGLLLKAGIPIACVNEIHGSSFDVHNPVLAMNDSLRPDLLAWMHEWRDTAEFVLCIGTSLCGMNADSVAEACALRHQQKFLGQGICILTLQQTRLDKIAAIKIYARIETVMSALVESLKLKLDSKVYDVPRRPPPRRFVKNAV